MDKELVLFSYHMKQTLFRDVLDNYAFLVLQFQVSNVLLVYKTVIHTVVKG